MFALRFELCPLDDVAPWPRSDRLVLDWFGLTDGRYWWEIDGHQLPRPTPGEDVAPGIDYPVVRLWEDVVDLAPTVLEAVPADLRAFVASDPATWAADADGDDMVEAAGWHRLHQLDLGYLMDPPLLRLWRTVDGDRDEVQVHWEHPRGEPAPPGGRSTITTREYTDAVLALGRDLMAAMRARVDDVCGRGGIPGVEIDVEALRREHEQRAACVTPELLGGVPDTDWAAVRRGARTLLGAQGRTRGGRAS